MQNSGDDIYDLLVREVERDTSTDNSNTNVLSSLHDLLLTHDASQHTPVTPHIVLKPSKLKPFYGRRKWVTPTTTSQTGIASTSINLLNGQLRHSLSEPPKHFVDQNSVDAALVDQGTIEQIPLHNYHRYLQQKTNQTKQVEHTPSFSGLVESFMDVLEDLATSHYYNNNYYNETGLYYNMMYDTTQSMKRFYDNAVGLYRYMFGEEERPKQHKRKFLRRLMKWFDENGPRVEPKKDEVTHEEPTTVIHTEEKLEYTGASFISLSFAIHHLRLQLKEKQKQEPVITPPFEMKSKLPRVFTLNDAYEYLQHLYDHSCTLPILLSQIPDYLENERDLLIVQKLMIKKQLKEIIRKEINDDDSIEERIENLTPEIEEKSSLLWFMHVMAKAKEERHWMKRLLISYRYRQVIQAILTYMSTKITEKTRYLTMVDKRVFSRAWIQKCYSQDPELGTAIIKKLL